MVAHLVHLTGEGEHGSACDVLLKNIANHLCLLRNDGEAFVFVLISEGSGCLPFACLCLFNHGLINFFCQIQRVVFRHSFKHGFVDNGEFIILWDRLFYGDYLHAVLFQQGFIQNGILFISGETVKFMYDDILNVIGFFPGLPNHGLKCRTLIGAFAGNALVHKNKFFGDMIAVVGGVFFNIRQLSGGGIIGLLVRGNTDISSCDNHKKRPPFAYKNV